MKRLALLLSIYILTLATTPVWSMFRLVPESVCCQENCSEEPAETSDSHEDDCGENCNPFQCCPCCLGFITPETPTIFQSLTSFWIRNDLFQSPVSTLAILPVWHPPKRS